VPAAAAPAEAEPKLYELWFGSEAGLTVRHVGIEPAPRDEARAVLESLLVGTPDSALHAAAPLRTPLRRVDVSEDVATVDLGAEFEQARDRRLALAQIVYTLTQFPDIEQVALTVAGESVARPAGRADFEDLLAPVVIEDPAGGAEIRSPLRVSGTATSRSGTVTVRSSAEVAACWRRLRRRSTAAPGAGDASRPPCRTRPQRICGRRSSSRPPATSPLLASRCGSPGSRAAATNSG
jgi:hypothetical protein